MEKEIKIKVVIYIIMISSLIIGKYVIEQIGKEIKEKEEIIKQLKQNNIEQLEEKEVYIKRCEMLEEIIIQEGVAIDNCECN